MKHVILLGGAPTAGKTTIARRLSTYLGLPWISTDQVRSIMQVAATRQDMPALFNPEGYTAERYLSEFSAKKIVAMEWKQSEAVWSGVMELIEDNSDWSSGCIIEGIGILPAKVSKDCNDKKYVKAIFLINENVKAVEEVIYTRGLWGPAASYSDSVKPKEVAWVLEYNKKVKSEATKYHLPVINVGATKNIFSAVKKILKV